MTPGDRPRLSLGRDHVYWPRNRAHNYHWQQYWDHMDPDDNQTATGRERENRRG